MRRLLSVVCAAGLLAIVACASAKPASLDVTVREFTFAPAELHTKVNRPVELRLKNDSQLPHDWTVEGMPASNARAHDTGQHDMASMGMMAANTLHTVAEQGTTSTITFTPTKAGTYTFFCTVPGHRAAGMQGHIVVE